MLRESPYVLGTYLSSHNGKDAALAIAADLQKQEQDPEWGFNLECITRKQDRPLDAAITACKNGLALNPKFFAGHVNLAVILYMRAAEGHDNTLTSDLIQADSEF
jgi:hypothetical protein